MKVQILVMVATAFLIVSEASAGSLTEGHLVSSLRDTAWSGSFSGTGIASGISIRFSPELSISGGLKYLHKLEGPSETGEALSPVDGPCEFTPRVLTITPADQRGHLGGEIRVYKCAKSAAEEASLAADPDRIPVKAIPVQSLKLSDDRRSLEIVAKILIETVTYKLVRVQASAKNSTASAERNIAGTSLSAEEYQGYMALKEVGFEPDIADRRSLREAGLLKMYQAAWNDFDPSIADPLKIKNPGKIVSHYTDGSGLLYRDMCTSQGLTTKENFTKYLTVLYAKFPKQVWGDGWKNIHLFKGAAPGEWAYYYDFSMYRSVAPSEKAALTGTGMERVRFEANGKLISDEVHLILKSGTATCQFGASQ